MIESLDHNEHKVAIAFSKQSLVFDDIYSANPIIQYKRDRVRKTVLSLLKPQAHILELNAGTGEDAVFFASRGYYVHATDISEGMLQLLHTKKEKAGVFNISVEQCSFTKLSALNNQGPFDHILSNFGGLNCTGALDIVLNEFDSLLKPGGTVTLVMISPFCLWESLQIFRGRFKDATRRWFAKGAAANVEGESFRCFYYKPSYIKKLLPGFEVVSVEGLCSLVPPSYMENFPKKFPRILTWLKKVEERFSSSWPFKSNGDYYIISLRKKIVY